MNNWLEQNKGLVFGLLVLVTLVGGGVFYLRQPAPPPLEIATTEPTVDPTATEVVVEVIPDTPTPVPTATPSPLRVYVTGEVNAPDVYYLPVGSIIRDALQAAGGETANADLLTINLAMELRDQQQITIPAKAEDRPTPPPIDGGVPPTAIPAAAPPPQTEAQPSSPVPGQKINLNTASVDELTTLPGVGPAIGQRIVDHRTENGPFTAIEGIMDVKGIGPATFEKMKDQITVQ
jgi:competence protein ComEA